MKKNNIKIEKQNQIDLIEKIKLICNDNFQLQINNFLYLQFENCKISTEIANSFLICKNQIDFDILQFLISKFDTGPIFEIENRLIDFEIENLYFEFSNIDILSIIDFQNSINRICNFNIFKIENKKLILQLKYISLINCFFAIDSQYCEFQMQNTKLICL